MAMLGMYSPWKATTGLLLVVALTQMALLVQFKDRESNVKLTDPGEEFDPNVGEGSKDLPCQLIGNPGGRLGNRLLTTWKMALVAWTFNRTGCIQPVRNI